jgi:hypothetical protein
MRDISPTGVPITMRDSEVSCIATHGDTLSIDLPVACVRGPSSRFLRAVRIDLDAAEILHRDGGCIGRLSDGELRIDGRRIADCRVPAAVEGRIELRLNFANGASLAANGRSLRLHSAGESFEYLHC